MNIKAWPFLISRNKKVDYWTLVAPQFMIGTSGPALLRLELGKPGDEPGKIIYRQIHVPEVGEISLFFRMIEARRQHIGQSGDKALIEIDGGRTIYLIEGIVLEGVKPDIPVTDEILQTAHDQIEPVFREFWKTTASSFDVRPSQALPLEGPPLRPPPPPPKQKLIIALVGAAAIIIVGIAWGLYRISPGTITGPNNTSTITTTPINTAAQTLTAFCKDLQGGNYQEAYNQLSTAIQQSLTKEAFTDFFSSEDHKIVACAFTLPNQSNKPQIAILTLQYQGGVQPAPLKIALIQEGKKGWKINSNIVEELQMQIPTPSPSPTPTPLPPAHRHLPVNEIIRCRTFSLALCRR